MMIVYLMVLCITNNVRNSKIRLINKWAGDIINSLRFLIIVIAIITIGIAAGLIDETILPVMESDSTLQSRIVQMILYYQTYGVSLFGTAIEISTEQGNSDLFTLDNGYAYLLLMYGVVIFLLFIFCYFCIAKRAAKEKNYEKIIAISIFAIVGFNETNMLRLVNNFTLLFFAELLWNSKQVTEKNIKWNVPPIS